MCYSILLLFICIFFLLHATHRLNLKNILHFGNSLYYKNLGQALYAVFPTFFWVYQMLNNPFSAGTNFNVTI